MSNDPRQFNDPYLPPQDYGAPPVAQPTKRPGGLTAVAVIAIILGSLGLMNAIIGLGGLIFSAQLQNFVKKSQGGEPKELRELRDKMDRVGEDFKIANIAATMLLFPVALALLVGGIKVLSLKPGSQSLLTLAVGGAFVFEVARGILAMIVQFRTMEVMNEGIQRMPAERAGENFAAIVQATMFIGLGCAVILLVAKLVFYGVSFLYLRKPNVQALFQSH